MAGHEHDAGTFDRTNVQRLGTWPARRPLSSFASLAKHLFGARLCAPKFGVNAYRGLAMKNATLSAAFAKRTALVTAFTLLAGCSALEQLLARLQSSTLITYRPIGYCAALVDEKAPADDGPKPILRHETLIFKIVSIENRQPVHVELRPSNFFIETLPRLPTNAVAERLTSLPPSLLVPRGATLSNPGVIAIPVSAAGSTEVFEVVLDPRPDGGVSTGYRIRLSDVKLRYDPGSEGDANSYVGINAGRRILDASRQPCTVRLVDEWALSR